MEAKQQTTVTAVEDLQKQLVELKLKSQQTGGIVTQMVGESQEKQERRMREACLGGFETRTRNALNISAEDILKQAIPGQFGHIEEIYSVKQVASFVLVRFRTAALMNEACEAFSSDKHWFKPNRPPGTVRKAKVLGKWRQVLAKSWGTSAKDDFAQDTNAGILYVITPDSRAQKVLTTAESEDDAAKPTWTEVVEVRKRPDLEKQFEQEVEKDMERRK